MQAAVVDQVQFASAGSPSSIVLDPAALARAAQLGRNVAEQLGRSYEEAEYRGDAGSCPECHLDVIALMPDGTIECATCGAAGTLLREDGRIRAIFSKTGRAQSILTRGEKLAHFQEVQETAARHAPLRPTIDALASEYQTWDRGVRPGR